MTGSSPTFIVPEMLHVRVIWSVVAVWSILAHAILQPASRLVVTSPPTFMIGICASNLMETVTLAPKVLVVVELIVLVFVFCYAFE